MWLKPNKMAWKRGLILCSIFVVVLFFFIVEASRFEDACKNDKLYQQTFKPQIERLSNDASKIVNYITKNSQEVGSTYNSLAKFVDKFGSRFTGTQNLEDAIDYMLRILKADGHDNVHSERVPVPHWVGCQYVCFHTTNKFSRSEATSGLKSWSQESRTCPSWVWATAWALAVKLLKLLLWLCVVLKSSKLDLLKSKEE